MAENIITLKFTADTKDADEKIGKLRQEIKNLNQKTTGTSIAKIPSVVDPKAIDEVAKVAEQIKKFEDAMAKAKAVLAPLASGIAAPFKALGGGVKIGIDAVTDLISDFASWVAKPFKKIGDEAAKFERRLCAL